MKIRSNFLILVLYGSCAVAQEKNIVDALIKEQDKKALDSKII
jgi:hypothetical protein